MTTKQAAKLTYYNRADKHHPVAIKPQAALLPRDTFAGHPDVLDAYDTMVTLNEQITSNQQAGARKEREADQAASEYRAAVAAALAEGKDPSKIKGKEQQLRAEAEAYRNFSRQAIADATRQGSKLGPLMAQVAPGCFPATEDQLTDAAAIVLGAINSLEHAWADWNAAWQVRRSLSHMHMRGGQQVSFQPNPGLPADVTAALGVLRDELDRIDVLKADESELTRWRDENAKAAASNAAAFAAQ